MHKQCELKDYSISKRMIVVKEGWQMYMKQFGQVKCQLPFFFLFEND